MELSKINYYKKINNDSLSIFITGFEGEGMSDDGKKEFNDWTIKEELMVFDENDSVVVIGKTFLDLKRDLERLSTEFRYINDYTINYSLGYKDSDIVLTFTYKNISDEMKLFVEENLGIIIETGKDTYICTKSENIIKDKLGNNVFFKYSYRPEADNTDDSIEYINIETVKKNIKGSHAPTLNNDMEVDDFSLTNDDFDDDVKLSIIDESKLKVIAAIKDYTNKTEEAIKFGEKEDAGINFSILSRYITSMTELSNLESSNEEHQYSEDVIVEKIKDIVSNIEKITYTNLDKYQTEKEKEEENNSGLFDDEVDPSLDDGSGFSF